MRIGISTASFYSKELTEDSFKIIHRLKIPLCEVFLSTLSEYESDFAELLNDRKGNTEIYSIHTLTQQYEPELFNMMPRTREDCEKILIKASTAAKILGAKNYIFHGPASYKKITFPFDYEKLGKRIEEIRQIVLKQTDNMTEVSYENVYWAYFNKPEYFTNIKKYSEVKACLDIKHARLSGYSVDEYVQTMGNRFRREKLSTAQEKIQSVENRIDQLSQL